MGLLKLHMFYGIIWLLISFVLFIKCSLSTLFMLGTSVGPGYNESWLFMIPNYEEGVENLILCYFIDVLSFHHIQQL